jgi:hypothetical protein
MTTFQDLQAEHEALLNRRDAPADAAQFITDVQHYINRICVEAAHIPAPRERDQLRAILRFWASYVFDKTATYPDTTLRPAMSQEASVSPTPSRVDIPADAIGRDKTNISPPGTEQSPLRRVLIIVGALAVCVIVLALLIFITPRAYAPSPGPQVVPTKEFSGPDVSTSTQPLTIESKVITGGPAPFDPNVWAVRLQLSATGGNGSYIFWVNSQHLPEASLAQLTVEGKGCTAEKPLVGVTSGGQAVSQQLVISSPLPNCPAP